MTERGWDWIEQGEKLAEQIDGQLTFDFTED